MRANNYLYNTCITFKAGKKCIQLITNNEGGYVLSMWGYSVKNMREAD